MCDILVEENLLLILFKYLIELLYENGVGIWLDLGKRNKKYKRISVKLFLGRFYGFYLFIYV